VIGFGGSEVGVGFRDEQSVSADGTGFGVGYEMKALLEEILQTRPKLFAGEGDAVFGLGVDVEVGGVEPGGWVGDLAAVDAVGQLDRRARETLVAVNRPVPGRLQLPVLGSAGAAGLMVATSKAGCWVCAVRVGAARSNGRHSSRERARDCLSGWGVVIKVSVDGRGWGESVSGSG